MGSPEQVQYPWDGYGVAQQGDGIVLGKLTQPCSHGPQGLRLVSKGGIN